MKRRLLVCMAVLMLVMMVLSGCKGNSNAVVLPVHAPTLYVGNFGGGGRTISVFTSALTATGDAVADRIITGSTTSVLGASGLVRDPGIDQLYVAGFASNSVGVYALASSASGTTVPARIITSATTTMTAPYGLWLDTAADRLYVSAYNANSIFVFDNASSADGATVPSRIITSSGTSTLNGPGNMWLDKAADQLYVTTQKIFPNSQIMVYNNASTADGNTVPSRIITSATTTLNALGLWLDKAADRLYVSGFNTNNIAVFDSASTADGPTVPARVIAGANTTLRQPTAIQLDPFQDMLYTANSGTSSIVVFDNASTISGDVVPSRIITRVNSSMAVPYGLWLDSP
jgi:hypothetical protein